MLLIDFLGTEGGLFLLHQHHQMSLLCNVLQSRILYDVLNDFTPPIMYDYGCLLFIIICKYTRPLIG